MTETIICISILCAAVIAAILFAIIRYGGSGEDIDPYNGDGF